MISARLTLAGIVCLLSMQITIGLAQLLYRMHPSTDAFNVILPEWAWRIALKWDLPLYIAFVVISIAGYYFAAFLFKSQWQSKQWLRQAQEYFCAEAVITFLMASAVFKMTIYDNSPQLAQSALLGLGILAIALKVFWLELRRYAIHLYAWLWKMVEFRSVRWGVDVCVLILIGAVIYLPDLERVIAQLFIGEQVHHFDYFLMSPGWASLHGKQPYVGVMSQYGVGVPYLLSRCARFFGGFDYVPVLKMYVTLVIGYYFLLYVVMRQWTKSILLSAAVFFVAFRIQMFHYGVSPLCWTYPSATPLRFGLDILWLLCILKHLQTRRLVYLFLAGAYSGFALYYMLSTGLCVAFTFYFYLAALVCVPHLRREFFGKGQAVWISAAAILTSILVALAFYYLTIGSNVIKPLFWHNLTEYMIFFAHGHSGGVLPMHESLKYRNYWVAFMAVMLPLAYVFTLIFLSGLIYMKRIRKEYLFVVIIAVYGLANYQYFVVRSAMTTYYVNGLPFVLVAVFWMQLALNRLDKKWQRGISVAAFFLSIYALFTNHNYISYPNMFNFSKNPMVDSTVAQHFPDRQGYFNHLVKAMKEEDKLPLNSLGEKDEDIRTEDSFKSDGELKAYMRKEFDFKEDAALIDAFVDPQTPAPILSSFETKILIQANRAPFFYHTPLTTSQPMRLRAFPSDSGHSPNFLKETIAELMERKPRYIFVERIFLQDNIPDSYKQGNSQIVAIAAYIKDHYTVVRNGKYLAAMQIK